ncbi:hypothetical protein [Agromyces archimandritae]|uniref:Uncharacterized protein n=1 Tax=Agromyces archimandritae TaxID=2781962 RepID=A0A975IRR0_9MICO|nr:hypothetical protein [Agromyces archimandritae]QTX06366.1 hypothetical protein G127AT_09490 [Agromyces archimandritae]
MPDPWMSGMLFALWLTVAILAGGFARTRNRSAWTWFVLTLVLGPIAAYLLVVWPVVGQPAAPAPRRPAARQDSPAR